MRNLFIKALSEKAKKNKNIILLSGDLGYKYFDEFNKSFPNRFINHGKPDHQNIECGIDHDNIVRTVLGALGIATPAKFSIEERA